VITVFRPHIRALIAWNRKQFDGARSGLYDSIDRIADRWKKESDDDDNKLNCHFFIVESVLS
jgi:hypothetical protein